MVTDVWTIPGISLWKNKSRKVSHSKYKAKRGCYKSFQGFSLIQNESAPKLMGENKGTSPSLSEFSFVLPLTMPPMLKLEQTPENHLLSYFHV